MGKTRTYLILGGILLLTAVTTFLFPSFSLNNNHTILFFSGAGMKIPVSEIVKNYTDSTGLAVDVHFEGSSVLRQHIELYGDADVFLSGDRENIALLEEKGLVREKMFIAWHIPSILVPAENKMRIAGLDDLARKGIRFVMSNPKQASLGKMVHEMLLKHPNGKAILKNVVVYGSSTQDDLRLFRDLRNKGGADAVIEWDVMVHAPEGKGLIAVPFDKEHEIRDALTIALLATSGASGTAKRFYDYFTTEGARVFKKHGYRIEAVK